LSTRDRSVQIGGWSLIIAALLFMAAFSYLARVFNYPAVLDAQAAEVLPRLLGLSPTDRAVWGIYGLIPLLLIPAGLGAYSALAPRAPAMMRTAVVFATLAAGAMMLGLLRWPSIQWMLATRYAAADPSARAAISGVFDGLNSFLGNYLGEFVGELALNLFFFLSALGFRGNDAYPRWVGTAGVIAAGAGFIAMWRNVTPAVALVAEINNYILPAWMILMGWVMVRGARDDHEDDIGGRPGT
jgi:hypothetical protein